MEFTYSRKVTKNTEELYNLSQVQEIIVNSDSFNKEVGRLRDIANKRIIALDNSKLFSPALNRLNALGIDKFLLRGKSYEDRKETLARILQFLNDPTSTIRGSREYQKQFFEKNHISNVSDMKMLYEIQEETKDYVFVLSRDQYYAALHGRMSFEEILSSNGFADDINDFRVEIDRQSHDIYNMYLTRMSKIDRYIENDFLNFSKWL